MTLEIFPSYRQRQQKCLTKFEIFLLFSLFPVKYKTLGPKGVMKGRKKKIWEAGSHLKNVVFLKKFLIVGFNTVVGGYSCKE